METYPHGRVVSVNIGMPREIRWGGTTVTTGIFKEPAAGRHRVRILNIDGDGQGDLSVHGGEVKAVYGYPIEHYDFWRAQLAAEGWPYGMFGENLTTAGLDESTIRIGDRFRVGSAELMVSQPRLPCFKLGIKFGREDMSQRFLDSGRTGFYFRVLREGEIGAGDLIECIGREVDSLTINRSVQLYFVEDCSEKDLQDLRIAVRLAAFSPKWHDRFLSKLNELGGQASPARSG